MMTLDSIRQAAQPALATLMGWLASPTFYAQVIALAAAVILARVLAPLVLRPYDRFAGAAEEALAPGLRGRAQAYLRALRPLIFPALLVVLLGAGVAVADSAVKASWLIRLGQSAALVYLLYTAINRFLTHPVINAAARWIGLPIATLAVFGYFTPFTHWLDSVAFSAGNIRISALALSKAAIFGGLLFWLGRVSSSAGQQAIRKQEAVDIQTRELAAKALDITIFAIAGFLLLNILGLDLTALAVFGGALGVGLGFGLQQIASNFISGIIILLERSLKVGDYIEMEDGKAGILREINMRSSSLATFDGKDIMVPNEKFITEKFVNWTKTDPQQRYEVPFSVSYDTDLNRVPGLIAAAVAKHPRVLKTPEPPDCELRGFGDSAVNFAVEFWVEGIDDGKNKFSSDVHFLIWNALRDEGIAMPYPHRVVHMVNAQDAPSAAKDRGRKKT
jgi:small-conductance mechanosensitive channel